MYTETGSKMLIQHSTMHSYIWTMIDWVVALDHFRSPMQMTAS